MARKQSIQPGRFCRECEHYYACSAQCGGLLHNTDATHCANFANISAYQEEIERLRLVVDEQDLALQKTENDLNTSRQAKWISVEDRLPETCRESRSFYHSVSVLAFEKGRIMLGYFDTCKDDGAWCFVGTDTEEYYDDCAKPTHWMPLPSTEGLHDN